MTVDTIPDGSVPTALTPGSQPSVRCAALALAGKN